jgi:hypothetical protein
MVCPQFDKTPAEGTFARRAAKPVSQAGLEQKLRERAHKMQSTSTILRSVGSFLQVLSLFISAPGGGKTLTAFLKLF